MDGVLQSYTILKKGLFQRQKLCAVTDRTGQKGRNRRTRTSARAQRAPGSYWKTGRKQRCRCPVIRLPQRAVFEDAFPQYLHLGEGYGLFQHIFQKSPQCGKDFGPAALAARGGYPDGALRPARRRRQSSRRFSCPDLVWQSPASIAPAAAGG